MELEGSDYDDIQSVKIVFLGDRSVGKTSIIRRFITGEFDEKQNVRVVPCRPQWGSITCSRQSRSGG